MFYKKNTGKASAPFIIICIILACFSIFCVYEFTKSKIRQNEINKAEYALTYGLPKGSVSSKEEAIKAAQKQKEATLKKLDEKRKVQEELNSQLIAQLIKTIESKDQTQIKSEIAQVKKLSMTSSDRLGVLTAVAIQVIEKDDAETLKTIIKSAETLGLKCQSFNYKLGKEFIKSSIDKQSVKSYETLAEVGCMNTHSVKARDELVAELLPLPEPQRGAFFNALRSKKVVQHSMLSKIFEADEQQVIVDYLSQGIIDKDFTLNSKSLLINSIVEDKKLVSTKLLKTGADRKGEAPYYKNNVFLTTVKENNLEVFAQLASAYPQDLDDFKMVEKIFNILSDESRKGFVSALIDNNAKILNMSYVNKSMLPKAVAADDLALVTYLLEQGVSPNEIYLKTTVLALALAQKPEPSEEIVKVLRQYGALEDVLDVVRKKRGISADEECKYSEQEVTDEKIFITATSLLKKPPKGEDIFIWPEVQQCEAGIVYCRDQGAGVDACMSSIPSCSSDVNGTVCCPSEIKEQYFEGRCAGLGVIETVMWMNVFSSYYGVPRNFR